jgi:hypothetical protein
MPGKKSKQNDSLLASLNLASEIPPPPTLEPKIRRTRPAPGPITLKPLSEAGQGAAPGYDQNLTEINQALFNVKLPSDTTPQPPYPQAMPMPGPARRRPISLGRSTRIFRDWGIPEWFVVSQALLLGLLFVPGLSSIRFATKMASFFTSLIALFLVVRDGRIRKVSSSRYQARNWLILLCMLLGLMMFHPGTYSPVAGLAHSVLYISNYAVAFWAIASLRYGYQLQRVFILIFLINSFSALLGIGQFYRPDTFFPPNLPVMQMGGLASQIPIYTLEDGTKVIRPSGLGDNPGQACFAGAMAASMGLILLTSRLPRWQRLAGLALAIPGATVIYLTQVRTAILMVVVSLISLFFVMCLQRRWKSIVQLVIAGLIVVVGGFSWAAREGGASIVNRFYTLLEGNPADVIMSSSRAQHVTGSLTDQVWDMPIGSGLGRYGQVYSYFGSGFRDDMTYAETQISAWIIDGGLAMLILGLGAVVVALADTLRVARKCPHPVIREWAAGVFAINVSLFFICFGQMPFLTNTGQQFWLLAALTHAADRWVRQQMKAQANMQRAMAV